MFLKHEDSINISMPTTLHMHLKSEGLLWSHVSNSRPDPACSTNISGLQSSTMANINGLRTGRLYHTHTHYWYYKSQNSLQHLGRWSRPASASSHSPTAIDPRWVGVYVWRTQCPASGKRPCDHRKNQENLDHFPCCQTSQVSIPVFPSAHFTSQLNTWHQVHMQFANFVVSEFKLEYDCRHYTVPTVHSRNNVPTPPTSCSNALHVWKHIPVWATFFCNEYEQNLTQESSHWCSASHQTL